jgi:ankyrin repeat protein
MKSSKFKKHCFNCGVSILLSQKLEETDGITAIHLACEHKKPEIVEFLLSIQRIDVNKRTTWVACRSVFCSLYLYSFQGWSYCSSRFL